MSVSFVDRPDPMQPNRRDIDKMRKGRSILRFDSRSMAYASITKWGSFVKRSAIQFAILLSGTLLLASLEAWAKSQEGGDLQAKMDRILRGSAIPQSQVGLVVYELNKDGQPMVYSHNEGQDFIPASVTKIATGTTVLARLGPSFKFQTTLWSSGKVIDGVLKGDLILLGGGDPGFVSESMWFLVNEFVRTGIRKIEGDIVVDDSQFDFIRMDASRDPERVDRAYDAPVGAMSFNWNSINIFVRPTGIGTPPAVILDPIDNGFKVDNRAKTKTNGGNHLEISRVGNRILVAGTIGLDQPEVTAFKNIDDPVEWSGHNLQFFLKQRGITVTGSVVSGRKPESAKFLAKAESKPVSFHVADMLKFSNNYVAEMLTKNLAAQNGTTPATLEQGMKLIRSSLQEIGIKESRFTLLNPSGLSRKNRIKPVDLAKILLYAQKNFPWFAEFLSALPLSGLDGTLKKRMKDGSAQGWVRAKTGNLAGVAALAGYAGRKDGTVRAFAFIFNGKNDLCESARHLFDALATELVQ